MTKKLTVTIILDEGTRKNHLAVYLDDLSETPKTILNIHHGEPRASLDALASTLKAKLL